MIRKSNGCPVVLFLLLTASVLAQQPPETHTGQQTAPPPSPAAAAAVTPAPQPSARPTPVDAPAEAASPAELNLPPTNDPKEIIRRAVEIDHRTLELARTYTCRQREVLKELDKHGNVKSTKIKTWDVNFYYGQEYSRLVQIDDKSLNEKELKKEDEKMEKFLAKYRNESESDRERRLAKEKKDREKGRLFLKDMLAAYDFRIAGEEKIDGVDTWIIETTPRKDFHPTQPHADILTKARGKLWIEKQGYNWVKVEGEVTDTISFGLFLARIHPGSRFVIDKTHLNNEVWLPRRFYVNGGIRIALVKNEMAEQEDILSDFRKFVTSSRIMPGVREVNDSSSSTPAAASSGAASATPGAVPAAKPTPTPR